MMMSSVRDRIMGEFAALGIGGGGAGLGEPGYQGSIADQSLPPGWTPNPSAYDPYYNTPGGDPFYSALSTAARQTQEPWILKSAWDFVGHLYIKGVKYSEYAKRNEAESIIQPASDPPPDTPTPLDFPPTWVLPANGLGAATVTPIRERQPSGSSLDRTRPEGRPQEIRALSADKVNRIRDEKLSTFDLPPSENPYDWPEFAIPYRVLYGLKQSIYKPIKSLLLDERPKYLDSNNNVQRVPWQPDRTDALIAFAQIASFFLPIPKASSLASDGAAGASALPEIVPELESALAPQLKSALPSTEAPSLFASRPTLGNIGGPQEGELAGLLRREGKTYYLEGSTTPLAGKHDFVIKNGEILVGKGHGFLAGGERVTWAGELNFANDGSGMLENFSNVSGHIRPYGGFVGNIDSPLLFGVPFVPPSYFPFGSTGGPQLPVFQPRF